MMNDLSKFEQFKNTIWCAPKNYEMVEKHKELFTSFFKDKLLSPIVKEDTYAPENMLIVVLDDLTLRTIVIK